jgi:modulator of FtsH protease
MQPSFFSIPMEREAFYARVLRYFGLSLLFGALGSLVAWQWGTPMIWFGFIAEFVLLLALVFIRNQEVRGILLFAFTFSSGVVLVPLLNVAIQVGGIEILIHALAISGLVFWGLSFYVLHTKKDFSFLHGFLMGALIAILVGGIVGFFIHTELYVLLYSIGIACVFGGFVLYDTSAILYRFSDDQYVDATLALYLDFLNLFVAILRILMIFASRDRD